MTQLSRYTLLERIGGSTLGAVYKARDTASGSLVALKVLQLGLLDDVSSNEMDARLQRDYEAAVRLQHPGIARVFEIRRDGRTALIATELVEGPPITSLANSTAGSDLGQVVAATVQLLDALDFAHNQLVIHRDLKPSNVLIQGGHIKITDFGMADLADRNREDTGALVGETEYMAPEQFLSGTIDKRCDIHAVGTILYQLLTGKSPFRGDPHTAAAMFKVLEFVPPPPSQVRPGLSPVFDSLVGRALAKKPEQRLVNARLFRNELSAAYFAVRGRAPPESLAPVATSSVAAALDTPRTTIVQSRSGLRAARASPQHLPSGEEPAKTAAPLRAQPPALPALQATSETAPLEITPAAPGASLRSDDRVPGSPTPASAPPSVFREPMRSAAEAIRAQPPPINETAPARPLPAANLPDGGNGAHKPAPLPGGTVLARPKPAMAPEAPPERAPVEPVQTQSPQAHETPAAEAMLVPPARTERPENGREPPQPGNGAPAFSSPPLSVAPSPVSRLTSLSAEPTRSAAPAESPVREVSSPAADSTPAQRPWATSFGPKRTVPLTNESIAHGGRVLAQFIGPIAIVFSRRAAQDAHDERGYFELLATHLADSDERTQFLRKVRQRPS